MNIAAVKESTAPIIAWGFQFMSGQNDYLTKSKETFVITIFFFTATS